MALLASASIRTRNRSTTPHWADAARATNVIAQNWLDLSAERGLSNFDQRHLLAFQMQYTTGQGIGGGTLLSGWRGALFKEWTAAHDDQRRHAACR